MPIWELKSYSQHPAKCAEGAFILSGTEQLNCILIILKCPSHHKYMVQVERAFKGKNFGLWAHLNCQRVTDVMKSALMKSVFFILYTISTESEILSNSYFKSICPKIVYGRIIINKSYLRCGFKQVKFGAQGSKHLLKHSFQVPSEKHFGLITSGHGQQIGLSISEITAFGKSS